MKAMTLEELAAARVAAKRAEDAAVAARREIDEQIVATLRLPQGKEEGTVSAKTGELKVSVVYGMNRKVDVEALRAGWEKLPEPVQNTFRWKAEVSVTEMRKLDEKESLALAKFVTATPATPSVKIDLA